MINNKGVKSDPKRKRMLRVESLCDRFLLASDLMNPIDRLDVNGDMQRTPFDALAIMNHMRSQAQGEAAAKMFPDTNGDGDVTPFDALQVIDALHAQGESVGTGSPMIRSLTSSGGDSPTIRFDGSNVTADVTVNSDGMLVVTGMGIAEEVFVGASPNVVTIHIDGYNNTLDVTNIATRDDLKIDVDGNNNVLSITNATIGDDFSYIGSDGIDVLTLNNVHVNDIFKFDGNDGMDVLTFWNSSTGDDFKFYGDDGNDGLAVANSTIGDDAIIRLGDDNDLLAAYQSTVRDVADARGGDYGDVLIASENSVTARRERIDEFEGFADAATTVDAFFAQARAVLEDYFEVPASEIDRIIGATTVSAS